MGGQLLLSWSRPVRSSSGYRSMAVVTASFGHAKGTRHASRCELQARARSGRAGQVASGVYGRACERLCGPVAVVPAVRAWRSDVTSPEAVDPGERVYRDLSISCYTSYTCDVCMMSNSRRTTWRTHRRTASRNG